MNLTIFTDDEKPTTEGAQAATAQSFPPQGTDPQTNGPRVLPHFRPFVLYDPRGGTRHMADIFISFIHEDEKVAEGVKRFLNEKLRIKSEVFLASDKWDIYAGEDWLKRIKEELASAKVVVLLLRKASIGRPWVNFEAGAAWIKDTAIIPTCFGDLQKEAIPKPYSDMQALVLDDDDGPYRLVISIHHHLKSPIPPPPFSPNDSGVSALRNVLAEAAQRLPEHLGR